MTSIRCEFCGTVGVQHQGVFSCANDLVTQIKKLKPQLRQAEDLLFKLVTNGMMDALKNDYEWEEDDLKLIKEIEKFTGFDDD